MSAFIRGDMRRYVELIEHADDYTLLAPFGGAPRYGFDASDEALDATAQFFRGGEVEQQVVATYASGDLVVLSSIERQHGEVGGLPDQELSLRVTLVSAVTMACGGRYTDTPTLWCTASTSSTWRPWPGRVGPAPLRLARRSWSLRRDRRARCPWPRQPTARSADPSGIFECPEAVAPRR